MPPAALEASLLLLCLPDEPRPATPWSLGIEPAETVPRSPQTPGSHTRFFARPRRTARIRLEWSPPTCLATAWSRPGIDPLPPASRFPHAASREPDQGPGSSCLRSTSATHECSAIPLCRCAL